MWRPASSCGLGGELAACSALLPFTGAIRPGGTAAWALLALSVPPLLAGELAQRI